MKKLVLLLILTATTFIGYAQENDESTIDAQRPSLTESYSIISTNIIQFENGIDYHKYSDTITSGTFVRGSITKKIELRAFTDYKHINTVGAKFIITEPEKSTLGLGTAFIYNKDLQNKANDYRVAITKDFKNIFVTYNFGYNDQYIYNIALIGIPINDKINYFIEYYNDPNTNRIHNGITWIPKRDIQFDLNGGWIDNTSWYAGLGVSFRLR